MRSAPSTAAAAASAALLCVLLSSAVSATNYVASMYPTPDALFFLNNLNKRLAARGSKESIQLNELLVRARFAVIGDLDPMHEHILTLTGEITGFPQVSTRACACVCAHHPSHTGAPHHRMTL